MENYGNAQGLVMNFWSSNFLNTPIININYTVKHIVRRPKVRDELLWVMLKRIAYENRLKPPLYV